MSNINPHPSVYKRMAHLATYSQVRRWLSRFALTAREQDEVIAKFREAGGKLYQTPPCTKLTVD